MAHSMSIITQSPQKTAFIRNISLKNKYTNRRGVIKIRAGQKESFHLVEEQKLDRELRLRRWPAMTLA